eukprot:m.53862 g.53862  ORF g.53862 m.53862 type:complete len:93 (-) comp16711_c0_seq2:172-450(-)
MWLQQTNVPVQPLHELSCQDFPRIQITRNIDINKQRPPTADRHVIVRVDTTVRLSLICAYFYSLPLSTNPLTVCPCLALYTLGSTRLLAERL